MPWDARKAESIGQREGLIAMRRAMPYVTREVKTQLNVGGGPPPGTPSTPPAPPHKHTAGLFNSISDTAFIASNGDVIGICGSSHPGARRLELGFVGTDRIGRVFNQQARPFLRPGFAAALDRVRSILKVGKKP